jgi:DNA repair protein RecO (recombination protein O)
MYIKTDGIVLREVAYQDSDKLLTVLTREYGKLTVRARGVRSSRSRKSRLTFPY